MGDSVFQNLIKIKGLGIHFACFDIKYMLGVEN